MNKDLQNQHDRHTVSIQQHSAEFFSGPLPHPEMLRKFNEVVPGSAERIIKISEDQTEHRKDLERRIIASDVARSKWAQILGFVIAIIGLVVSGFVAIYGNAIAGSIIGVGTLGSLVSVFMYGSKIRGEEKEEEN